MKVRLSVIASGLSGKSGDLVGSNWKGRTYIRRRVIPANPRTQKQQDQRNALARLVQCWQALDSDFKTFLDKLGSDEALSGYNVYVGRNIADEKLNNYHPIIPDNRYALPMPSLGTQVPQDGQVEISWPVDQFAQGDQVAILYRKEANVAQGDYQPPWTLDTKTVDATAGSHVVTDLEVEPRYVFCAIPIYADGNLGKGATAVTTPGP